MLLSMIDVENSWLRNKKSDGAAGYQSAVSRTDLQINSSALGRSVLQRRR
jgi:hypothetical protein